MTQKELRKQLESLDYFRKCTDKSYWRTTERHHWDMSYSDMCPPRICHIHFLLNKKGKCVPGGVRAVSQTLQLWGVQSGLAFCSTPCFLKGQKCTFWWALPTKCLLSLLLSAPLHHHEPDFNRGPSLRDWVEFIRARQPSLSSCHLLLSTVKEPVLIFITFFCL